MPTKTVKRLFPLYILLHEALGRDRAQEIVRETLRQLPDGYFQVTVTEEDNLRIKAYYEALCAYYEDPDPTQVWLFHVKRCIAEAKAKGAI